MSADTTPWTPDVVAEWIAEEGPPEAGDDRRKPDQKPDTGLAVSRHAPPSQIVLPARAALVDNLRRPVFKLRNRLASRRQKQA